MNTDWKLLNWEHVCQVVPGVETERKEERLDKCVQKWWDSLSPEKQRELLLNELAGAKSTVEALEQCRTLAGWL